MNQKDAEEFVRVWQTSKSAIEVAEKLNIKAASARQNAVLLRKMGVSLKKMTNGPQRIVDYEKLKELAESLLEK